MRVLRWALVGAVLVLLGALTGFAISLLRPRRYGQPPASGAAVAASEASKLPE